METVKNFTAEEINAQLLRILDSVPFRNSPVLSRFLSYIVSETLQEKQYQIKEYSIALDVLHRPPDFNSNDDAIVRIHAGRLRRALNEYYLTKGISDPVLIHIPKGGYVPEFEEGGIVLPVEPVPPVIVKQHTPVVAVFPFRILSPDRDVHHFSVLIGEQLSAELSRFRDLSVIGYYSQEVTDKIDENVMEAARMVNADYVIMGSLQRDGNLIRVCVQYLVTDTGKLMMIRMFECDAVNGGLFDAMDEIVKSITGTVGGLYGLVTQELLNGFSPKIFINPAIRKALSGYYLYQRHYSAENYRIALEAMEHAVHEHQEDAELTALLGELYLNGIGIGKNNIDELVNSGYQCAMQALRIDPLCQHAWYTLALVRLFEKDKAGCQEAAYKSIQLNPNNAVLVAGAGALLVLAGEFDKGFGLMEKAVKFNPHYPWWINIGFSLYHLHKKEYDVALFWTERINAEELSWSPLLKCITHAYLGHKHASEKHLTALLELEPEASSQVTPFLSSFILSDELITQMMGGLLKAGLRKKSFTGKLL